MKRIEDYGLIGDSRSAALVSRDGSIEWLCFPRFDSAAVFAALLGDENHGHWTLAAADPTATASRRYRPGTAVLETRFETPTGAATVIDYMAPVAGEPGSQLIRLVRGDVGEVDMRTTLRFRFDYGRLTPWLRRVEGGVIAVAGPDAVRLTTPVPLVNRDWTTSADFRVAAGQRTSFALTWFPSHLKPPPERDPHRLLDLVDRAWRRWTRRSTYRGPWRDAVERSLITLKLLTYQPTGGIVAAPTTSLPEQIGGARNWDYRYCWIRDATLTLYALLSSGYRREAQSWRRWLLRAAAGSPQDLQIMYGLHGEPRLPESILDWLPGFAGSRPVRVGNAAQMQLQLDVFGELTGVLHAARRFGMGADEDAWRLQKVILRHLEDVWREPDAGLWEVRGPQRHFVHSKVMAWFAFDRMIASARAFGLDGPVDHWCDVRDTIRAEVCEKGFDRERGTFVQYYGATRVDAALLYIPIVGFLPPDDPRVLGTLAAVEQELLEDGLMRRYSARGDLDGLPGEEGAFLACSFWLCDVYRICGREDDARALFERLLGLSNDLGLLAEEYDPRAGRQLGNFPQAFSHVALINSAHGLTTPETAVAEHARADTASGRA